MQQLYHSYGTDVKGHSHIRERGDVSGVRVSGKKHVRVSSRASDTR